MDAGRKREERDGILGGGGVRTGSWSRGVNRKKEAEEEKRKKGKEGKGKGKDGESGSAARREAGTRRCVCVVHGA